MSCIAVKAWQQNKWIQPQHAGKHSAVRSLSATTGTIHIHVLRSQNNYHCALYCLTFSLFNRIFFCSFFITFIYKIKLLFARCFCPYWVNVKMCFWLAQRNKVQTKAILALSHCTTYDVMADLGNFLLLKTKVKFTQCSFMKDLALRAHTLRSLFCLHTPTTLLCFHTSMPHFPSTTQ